MILSGTQMKALDEHTTIHHHMPSMVLMERAALACVEVLRREEFDLSSVVVFCGPGNNGGDGIAIARLLHLAGTSVAMVLIGNPDKRTPQTQHQLQIARSYEVPTVALHEATASCVIDAVLGIGSVRKPTGDFLTAINLMNSMRTMGAHTLAVDIPTGVSADTGEALGEAVHADVTVSFAYLKVGLTLTPGSTFAGKVIVEDIGIYDCEAHNALPSLVLASDKVALPSIQGGPGETSP